MKNFIKKLTFFLATCLCFTSNLDAVKTRNKHNNLQLKHWNQQPVRYKMSVNVFEDNKNRKLLIKVITPNQGSFENTYIESKAINKFGWDPRWMSCYDSGIRDIQLYILPKSIKYKSSVLPLILYKHGSINSNIFNKDHPICSFVDKYLNYWITSWDYYKKLKYRYNIRRF